jgi:hypothetical protein
MCVRVVAREGRQSPSLSKDSEPNDSRLGGERREEKKEEEVSPHTHISSNKLEHSKKLEAEREIRAYFKQVRKITL